MMQYLHEFQFLGSTGILSSLMRQICRNPCSPPLLPVSWSR
jgi:hypothetical protein